MFGWLVASIIGAFITWIILTIHYGNVRYEEGARDCLNLILEDEFEQLNRLANKE